MPRSLSFFHEERKTRWVDKSGTEGNMLKTKKEERDDVSTGKQKKNGKNEKDRRY
jgi:hypothetical protein